MLVHAKCIKDAPKTPKSYMEYVQTISVLDVQRMIFFRDLNLKTGAQSHMTNNISFTKQIINTCVQKGSIPDFLKMS